MPLYAVNPFFRDVGWHRLSADCGMSLSIAWPGRMSVRRSRARPSRCASCACGAPTIGRVELITVAGHNRPTVAATRLNPASRLLHPTKKARPTATGRTGYVCSIIRMASGLNKTTCANGPPTRVAVLRMSCTGPSRATAIELPLGVCLGEYLGNSHSHRGAMRQHTSAGRTG